MSVAEQVIWWIGSIFAIILAGWKIWEILLSRPKLEIEVEDAKYTIVQPRTVENRTSKAHFVINFKIVNKSVKPITIKKIWIESDDFKAKKKQERTPNVTNYRFEAQDSQNFTIIFIGESANDEAKGTLVITDATGKKWKKLLSKNDNSTNSEKSD